MSLRDDWRCPSCGHLPHCECPENCWALYMNSLLGEQVRVTVDNDKHVVVVGTLLAWSEMGETIVEDRSGDYVHCWPALHVAAWPDLAAMQAVWQEPEEQEQVDSPEAPGA